MKWSEMCSHSKVFHYWIHTRTTRNWNYFLPRYFTEKVLNILRIPATISALIITSAFFVWIEMRSTYGAKVVSRYIRSIKVSRVTVKRGKQIIRIIDASDGIGMKCTIWFFELPLYCIVSSGICDSFQFIIIVGKQVPLASGFFGNGMFCSVELDLLDFRRLLNRQRKPHHN